VQAVKIVTEKGDTRYPIKVRKHHIASCTPRQCALQRCSSFLPVINIPKVQGKPAKGMCLLISTPLQLSMTVHDREEYSTEDYRNTPVCISAGSRPSTS